MLRLPLSNLLRRKAAKPAPTARPNLECLEGRIAPATLTVDPSSGLYHTITAALAAANPGDTVSVKPGTYNEAVTVSKANINLMAYKAGTVTVRPDATKVSQVTIGTAQGGDAVIDVWAAGVKVNGFIVDGFGGGADLWAGIRVLNGGTNATISNNVVQNFVSAPSLFQNLGIQVGSSYFSSPGSATVNNNTVKDYAGAGVFVGFAGSSATVNNNTITGRGTANTIPGQTGVVTEYGVQVGDGTFATVVANTISNNTTTGPASGHNSPLSAGIYYINANVGTGSQKKTIENNTVFGNDDGILVERSNGTATNYVWAYGNKVYGNYGYAGIDVLSSNYALLENNTINNNSSKPNLTFNGIALTTSQNVTGKNNTITSNGNAASATDGIYDYGGSFNTFTGNTIYGNSGNGISLEHCTRETVSSNAFNSGSTFNVGYGIKLTGTTNSTGTGNRYGSSTRQILQDSASTGNTINGTVTPG